MNRTTRRGRLLAAGALLCALAATAAAQTVAFSGMLGDKALLIINGHATGVAVGATVQGVKLLHIDGASAQVDVGGKTQTLRLGGAAVVAGDPGGGSGGSRIVLPAGSGGHYRAWARSTATRCSSSSTPAPPPWRWAPTWPSQLGLDPRTARPWPR